MKKRPSNPIKDTENVLNIQDYLLANSQPKGARRIAELCFVCSGHNDWFSCR